MQIKVISFLYVDGKIISTLSLITMENGQNNNTKNYLIYSKYIHINGALLAIGYRKKDFFEEVIITLRIIFTQV
jgi:hypothetical protein